MIAQLLIHTMPVLTIYGKKFWYANHASKMQPLKEWIYIVYGSTHFLNLIIICTRSSSVSKIYHKWKIFSPIAAYK